MNATRHIRIKRGHHLLHALDDSRLDPLLGQVLRHLKANKAASRHNRAARRVLLDKGVNSKGILYIAQRKNSAVVYAGQRWAHRLCARREDQLIIRFFIHNAIVKATHGNVFPLRVNRRNFVVHPYLNAEARPKACGRLQGERLPVCDLPANVVGQAAVSIGDVAAALQYNDFCLLI